MNSTPIVTLLSDFGTGDGYIGAIKGVILRVCPSARIIDLSHEIPACNVFAGALALQTAARWFPSETIHMAVVDPGVGGDRRPLLVEAAGATFIGPDNGLLSLAAPPPRSIFHLDRPRFFAAEISPTFHGRDVFAPIAGHLAAGVAREELATRCDSMVNLAVPEPYKHGCVWVGQVIHIDRFGNLVTSLRREHLGSSAEGLTVEVAGRRIGGISQTYCDVADGETVALIGSCGYLEVAVRGGSASHELGIERAGDSGVSVSVAPKPER